MLFFPHVKHRFCRIGRLKIDVLPLRAEKMDPFQVAIDKIRVLQFRVDKAAVVQVGIVKSGFKYHRPCIIEMDDFRTLKAAIVYLRARERGILQIGLGKVTARKDGKIKKRQVYFRAGKSAQGKFGFLEIAAVEFAIRKVYILKAHQGSVQVTDDSFSGNMLGNAQCFKLGIGLVRKAQV